MPIGYPNADILNVDGWKDNTGSTFNIYTAIDEAEPPNFADYVTAVSILIMPAPNLAYTHSLSSPGALSSGESYLMSCYASAAYATGGPRFAQWELLQGAAVIETVTIAVPSSGPTHFTHVVIGTVTDPTQLRYRHTLLGDGTDWRETVYQADIRPVFPHLDAPSSTGAPKVVAAFSGAGLVLGGASPVPAVVAGAEVPATLVIDGPVPRVHG